MNVIFFSAATWQINNKNKYGINNKKKDTMAMFNFAIATASFIFLNLTFENRDSRFERAIKISCHPNCQVSNSCGFFNKNK